MKNFLFVLGFTLILSGCGEDLNNGDNVKETATLNNENPRDFYNRFRFQILKEEQLNGTFKDRFYYATSDLVELSKTLRAQVALFIYENGTYEGIYREYQVLGEQGGITQLKEVYKNQIPSSHWEVQNLEIVLKGLGRGLGYVLNSEKVFSFKFETSFSSNNIQLKRTTIYQSQSYSDPRN